MVQTERTNATGERVHSRDTGGGIRPPVLDVPTDRGAATETIGGGMRDRVGIEKRPSWVSARLLADSDEERRLHEGAHGTLHVGAGGKRDLEVGLDQAARLDALAPGGHGVGRRVRRLPPMPIVDFDTGALADVAKGDRRRERGASIAEGL